MPPGYEQAGYENIPPESAAPANRAWWDAEAADYLAEHGSFLGDAELVWGPEGVIEDDVSLLGDVRGLRVLEVGCGAGQGARWARAAGAAVVGIDLSGAMLRAGSAISQRTGNNPPLVQANALQLPFAAESFDLAFSAFGAVPFVADLAHLHQEVARVLRPGGRWVFATSHPVRWAFPDVPTEAGLQATMSYFDRTPYAERDAAGAVSYVEYHRTLGDHVAALRWADLSIEQVTEPEWPEANKQTWGGWSPLRGHIIPGTIIFSAAKPVAPEVRTAKPV